MRTLVRLRVTRTALLFLADRGILRHSTEEAIKRDMLARSRMAEVVPLDPKRVDAKPEPRSVAR